MSTPPMTPGKSQDEESRIAFMSSSAEDATQEVALAVPVTPLYKPVHDDHIPDRPSVLVAAPIVLFAGLLFGWGLSKAGVYRGDIIRDQFYGPFSNNIMLMTFLIGFVVTVAVFLGARALGLQAYVQRGAGKHCIHPSAGVPAAAIGGFLIGAGMMISGACPGTMWAQLGAGEWTALITMAGGVVGVYVFALLHPYLKNFMAMGKIDKDKFKLYHMLNTTPYITGGVFMAACIGVVVALLLTVYEPIPDTGKGGDARYWNPVLGGLFIGATQIPLLYAGRALGSSTSFVVMASHLAYPIKSSKYLNGQRGSFGSVWSLPFVLAAAGGSALATVLSENDSWNTAHVSNIAWYEQFLGGIVLLFGARLASGCTSGHGITGMGTQSIISMAATGSMFLGGIVVAAIYTAAA